MNDYIVRTENLGYAYEDDGEQSPLAKGIKHPALDGVSLSVKRGEYLAILGHNGSGKSTFAKLLNMILTPTVGKVYIDGVDISDEKLTEDEIFDIRSKIGMVFQNPDNQLVATVVEEDVAFGPENLGLEREEIRRRVDEALSLVGMTEYAKHAPHKLSGGQKQRVAIAGIIAMRPELIIFDEATAMLDPIGRREVLDIMHKLNREENITVINITHYMDEASLADRVVVINDGRLLMDSTPREVFSKPASLHLIGLEAPQSAELIDALIDEGVDIERGLIYQSETAEALIRLLGGDALEK